MDDDQPFGQNETPQSAVFVLDPELALFGDSPLLLTVNVSPVNENVEDDLLEKQEWWRNEDSDIF